MNCNCCNEENTIKAVVGHTCNIEFTFDIELSDYSSANFVVRKSFDKVPVINKTITELNGNTLGLELTPAEMSVFTEFENGKNQASYIWGLDFIDSENNIIVPAFPNVGEHAPSFIVYKSVTGA